MEQICVDKIIPSPAEICAIDNTYGCNDPALVYPEDPDPAAETARSELLTRIGRKPWLHATAKVDAANRDYARVMSLSPERPPEDFVRRNIARAKSLSPTKCVGPPEDVVLADGDGGAIFTYSTQARNCVGLATMKLAGRTALGSGPLGPAPMAVDAGRGERRWQAGMINKALLPARGAERHREYDTTARDVDLGIWRAGILDLGLISTPPHHHTHAHAHTNRVSALRMRTHTPCGVLY